MFHEIVAFTLREGLCGALDAPVIFVMVGRSNGLSDPKIQWRWGR